MSLHLIKRITLAKALLKLASINTDKGVLTYEGELTIGTEVFMENPENGEVIPAVDGEYIAENKKITVEEGKVKNIENIEGGKDDNNGDVDELMAKIKKFEEDTTEKDNKIAELEAKVAELETSLTGKDAIITEKDGKIAELEAKVAEMEAKIAELNTTIEAQKEKLSAVPTSVTKTEPNNNSAIKFAWAK